MWAREIRLSCYTAIRLGAISIGPFSRPLSTCAWCIVPDHMGMGKPGVLATPYPYRLRHHIDNLETFILRLELRDITLAVHDWGGPVGLGFAIRHPGRLKRLILMNTWALARWPGGRCRG